jgi:predicted transcriptional regulator
VKSSNDEILRFIASSFRSVWALELLLVLKSEQRSWSHDELVATMRASELVVTRALAALEAAGLVSNDGDEAQYMPVSDDVATLVTEAEALYAKRPDAVRRAIVSASSGDATAFAEAFRLRKD